MFRTLSEDLFFIQNISIKKQYTNRELKFHHYFHSITKLYPVNIIIIDPFLFFFVNKQDYFKAKLFLNALRKKFNKKVLIVRNETTLMNLLHELFPDTYIHDLRFDNENTISVCFLTWEERGIACGTNGDYIKTVNQLFKHHIHFEKPVGELIIKCELVDL
ncbi:MAG: hypothetical protein ACTSUN_00665 [Promethearchaeota archaeon]